MDNLVAAPTVHLPNEGAIVTPTANPYLELKPQEEAPFTLYEQDNNQPYTAKFFNIADYQTLKNIEPDGIASKIQDIENYVRGKIENDNYFNSTKTYKDIIGDIREILGIKEFEPAYQQIEKIHSFVSINQPKEVKEVKPKIAPNKQIQFNKRIDTQINKHIQKYIKNVDGQFKKLDQTLYKRVDDQLKKVGHLQKVSKTIDKYLSKLHA